MKTQYGQDQYNAPMNYGEGGNNYGNPMPSIMSPQMTPTNMMPSQDFSNDFDYQSSEMPMPSSNYYAKGGHVKGGQSGEVNPEALQLLAQLLQQQGQREDTILAHINPQEAALLEENFGGDVNPHTGLPQFGKREIPHFKGGGLFGNPLKWLAGSGMGTAGALAGNMLLPGIGGILGGALGGAAGSAVRGRKDYLQAGMRGAGQGAIIPTLASLGGSALEGMGAPGIGGDLSRYGNDNAILPSLDRLMGHGAKEGASAAAKGGKTSTYTPLVNRFTETAKGSTTVPGVEEVATSSAPDASKDFMGSLTAKTKEFGSDPKNLLALGALAMQYMNQPKEKTPEQIGNELRRQRMAEMNSPEEDLQIARNKRYVQRNQYLPEERLGDLPPVYTRHSDPEEARRTGRWVSHYDNPQFTGMPLYRKEGGRAKLPPMVYEEEVTDVPSNLAGLLRGTSGGQADNRKTKLPDGSYIIDASTVADLGDGNTEAGGKALDAWVSDGEYRIPPMKVAQMGGGDNDKGASALDKMVRNIRKHKGGSVKLPPKAKPISQYMR